MKDYLRCIAAVDDNVGRVLEVPRRDRPGRQHGRHLHLRPGLLPGRARLVRQAVDVRGIAAHAAAGPLAGRRQAGQRRTRTSSRTSTSPRPSSTSPAWRCPPTCRAAAWCRCWRARRRTTGARRSTTTTTSFPAAHSVRRHYGVATERYKLIHFYPNAGIPRSTSGSCTT